jgi:hypothetical protein
MEKNAEWSVVKQINILGDVMMYSLVDHYRRFGGAHRLKYHRRIVNSLIDPREKLFAPWR